MGVQSTKTIASVGAYGAGKLFGGEELAKKWFEKVSGIGPGGGKEVNVTVGIDPQNGNIQAYVGKQIGQSNTEMINGAGGGAMVPSFGWRGG
jgi:hypothetical protein